MGIKKRRASAVIYIIAMFVTILAFCAFAVDATIVFNHRGKLQSATEAAALAGAAGFDYEGTSTSADIEQKAQEAFSIISANELPGSQVNVSVNVSQRQVLVETTANSPTFFLSFLGVSSIELKAKSLGICERLDITSHHPGINWITASAVYLSDIISMGLNLNDTAILLPLGNFKTGSYDGSSGTAKYDLLDSKDDKPLSLGPGGFVTIKLPAPIIDKPGPDLYISEIGAQEGYFVFAGLDNNPEKPYVKFDNPGDGISWVNISCSGVLENKDATGSIGKVDAQTPTFGLQTKFYGSGYFDFGSSCIGGGISMAKYIRIIDDNSETGFVTSTLGSVDPNKYYKARLYGEASGPTPGADIDSLAVLNHVKLESPSKFVPE